MVRSIVACVLPFVALSTVACSADAPPEQYPAPTSSNRESAPAPSGTGTGGTQAPAPSSSSSSGSGSTTGTGSKTADPSAPADPADKAGDKDPPQQADPACVQSCGNAGGLKSKCQGDDTFCDDVCSYYTSTEIACLTSAPTCDKTEWQRCEGDGQNAGQK